MKKEIGENLVTSNKTSVTDQDSLKKSRDKKMSHVASLSKVYFKKKFDILYDFSENYGRFHQKRTIDDE